MILKRTILAALVCIAATTSIFAEAKNHAYRLKGVVTDSLTNAGEPYATLSIVRKGEETKPLKMAVTDADALHGAKVFPLTDEINVLNTCLVYSKNLHLKKYMLDFIEQIEALYAESGLE